MNLKDLALPGMSLGALGVMAAKGLMGPEAQSVASKLPLIGMAAPSKGQFKVPVPIYKPSFIDKIKDRLPNKDSVKSWGGARLSGLKDILDKRINQPLNRRSERISGEKQQGSDILDKLLRGEGDLKQEPTGRQFIEDKSGLKEIPSAVLKRSKGLQNQLRTSDTANAVTLAQGFAQGAVKNIHPIDKNTFFIEDVTGKLTPVNKGILRLTKKMFGNVAQGAPLPDALRRI